MNNFVILYYAAIPIIATFLRSDDEDFSYIFAINLIIGALIFFNRLMKNNRRFKNYEVFYIIFGVLAFTLDIYRGEFYVHDKLIILSLFTIIGAPSIHLKERLQNKLHYLFLFYIVLTFAVILFQRATGIFWERTAVIKYIDLAEQNNYRFTAFWSWIDWVSILTTFPVVTAIVVMRYVELKKYTSVYLLTALSVTIAILTGNRSLMLFSLILSFLIIDYTVPEYLIKVTRTIIIYLVILVAFALISNLFNISIESIYEERIYQGNVLLEYRSEYARILNYQFFFEHGVYLFGAGNVISSELFHLMNRRSAKMLIGILEPAFTYGIISIFYYLFLFSLLKKCYVLFKKTKQITFFLILLGFILINLTTNVPYMIGMQAFLFFLYYEKYLSKSTIRTMS